MPPGHDLDHDPAVFDALHGLIARVDAELLPDRLLDRDLTALSYSTRHDTYQCMSSYPARQYCRAGSRALAGGVQERPR